MPYPSARNKLDDGGAEVLVPLSRDVWLNVLRPHTIGASDIPAVLGASPWQTPFDAWARYSGLAPPVRETLAMRLGNHDESFILQLVQEAHVDWFVEPNVIGAGGKFYRDLDAGISATPDSFIEAPERPGIGVCNAKRVGRNTFDRKWRVDSGEIEVPSYVAIQSIQEMMLTGASWGCVACLVASDSPEFHLLEVSPHPGIATRIRTAAADFWRRVSKNDPYPPDYGRDGALIKHIYADDNDGAVDLSNNQEALKLVARHEALKLIESSSRGAGTSAKKERDCIDARLLHEFLGNAVRADIGSGRMLEAKVVKRSGYPVKPSISRPLKITKGKPVVLK